MRVPFGVVSRRRHYLSVNWLEIDDAPMSTIVLENRRRVEHFHGRYPQSTVRGQVRDTGGMLRVVLDISKVLYEIFLSIIGVARLKGTACPFSVFFDLPERQFVPV